MSAGRAEPDEFEIEYKPDRAGTIVVERLKADQLTFEEFLSSPFVRFMGDVDGKWTLLLQCAEERISEIRNVTVLGERPQLIFKSKPVDD